MKFQLEKYGMSKVVSVVPGGKTGQDSIYIGLKEAEKNCSPDDVVLIHDGVRPFISPELISRNIADTRRNGNSITCTGCNETFIISKDTVNVDSVPVRRESYNAQAPQAFRLGEIIEAHEQMRKEFEKCLKELKEEGKEIEAVRHPRQIVKIGINKEVFPYDLIRIKKSKKII